MANFTPRQTSRNLNGTQTDVLLQTFADRVLVLVSQMGKVGNLIQATLQETVPLLPLANNSDHPNSLSLPEPSPAVQLTPLLGGAPSNHLQILHSLYVAQIATIIWTEEARVGLESSRRSVIVGLALSKSEDHEFGRDELEKEVFQGVMSMLYDLWQSK